MRALVTGGAGFIGSHLSRALVGLGFEVTILDNFERGSMENLSDLLCESNNRINLIVGDSTDPNDIRTALRDVDAVFHLAAISDVRYCQSHDQECFRHNVGSTRVLLEEMVKRKADRIVYASTSTVYGEPNQIPTPEDYEPLRPISAYGESKLASEALIASHADSHNASALILRLANIVGPRSNRGVWIDFIRKLRMSPHDLEILGDGAQVKSYLHVDDCIQAMLRAFDIADGGVEVFNVGSEDQIETARIAEIVIEEMGMNDVKLCPTSNLDGRGWVGDVKNMLLDITRLRSIGWSPQYNSEDAIRLAIRSFFSGKNSDLGKSRATNRFVTVPECSASALRLSRAKTGSRGIHKKS